MINENAPEMPVETFSVPAAERKEAAPVLARMVVELVADTPSFAAVVAVIAPVWFTVAVTVSC